MNEIDLTPPAQPVAAGEAYSLWSIDLVDSIMYTIGTEVNGEEFSTIDTHSLADLIGETETTV